jgi:hypothetical protein
MYSVVQSGLPAAQAAVRLRARQDFGQQVASELEVRLFQPEDAAKVKAGWIKAAERSGRVGQYNFTAISNVFDYFSAKPPEEWGPNSCLVMAYRGQPVTLSSLIGDESFMDVRAIRGSPEDHPLRGQGLSYTHTALAGVARQNCLDTIIYHGPFSPGSIKSVERGALPINPEARRQMWVQRNVCITTDGTGQQLRLGKAKPPKVIAPIYSEVYHKLFGRPYQP